MSYRRAAYTVCASVLLSLTFVFCAHAQLTDTGAIAGTITDQSGAPVPDAKITVTNLGTNVQQIVTSNTEGQYVVPTLKVGTYSLAVEKTGFAPFLQTGIVIDVQVRVAADVKLQVGGVQQRVEVTGSPVLLHSQSA